MKFMFQSQRKNVFISYSHADAEWLKRLKVHLKPLEREGAIDLWSDEKIHAGLNWKEEISKALKEATVAVLLISADFLASDFIINDELPPLLAAAKKEATVILPVIVGHSSFMENKSLFLYQTINSPDKPVEGMTKADQNAVFYNLYKTILSILGRQEEKDSQDAYIEPERRVQAEDSGSGRTVSRKLRFQAIEDLDKDEVTIMIKEKGFFDVTINSSASGFSNQFELQQGGKVVYDHATCLMWQQSGSENVTGYKKVKSYINALNRQNFAGYSDWRLPTLEEAMSLMKSIKNDNDLHIDSRFDNKQRICTSDYTPRPWLGVSRPWAVYFDTGSCYNNNFYYNIYVRAVR